MTKMASMTQQQIIEKLIEYEDQEFDSEDEDVVLKYVDLTHQQLECSALLVSNYDQSEMVSPSKVQESN